jgi:hypothetical protein
MTATTATRKFGIEIEAYGVAMGDVATALRAAGIAAQVETYNHNVSTGWKLVTDGSLAGLDRAFELVSPVLEGAEGVAQVAKVGEVLKALGAKVNKQCGLHVHVDARTLNVKQVGNVVKMFAKYEANFDALMPASRRDNRFCKSVLVRGNIDSTFDAVDRATTIDTLRREVNQYDRYRKLNLESLVRHGTIEFRQHAGTVEGEKMVEWVKLVTAFVTDAANAKAIRKTGAGNMDNLIGLVDAKGRKYLKNRVARFATV